MTLDAAIKKAVNKTGDGRIRRRAWTLGAAAWRLTVCIGNNEIWWSHTTPMTPWIPKVSDLLADDWIVVK